MAESNDTDKLSITQRRAIYFLVSRGLNETKTAEVLDVHPRTIKRWMKTPYFRQRLDEAFQRIEKHDYKYRIQQNKIVVDELYGEIHRRIGIGRLKDMEMGTLLKAARDFNQEVRLDSPGEATAKVMHEHVGVDKLMERFKDAKSKGYVDVEKPKLSLVDQPAPEKKEAANE